MFNFHPTYFLPDLCKSVTDGDIRVYETISGNRYPSVTSVISKTMSEEKAKILTEWMLRVGEDTAEKTKTYAANRGEALHLLIEYYLKDFNFREALDKSSPKIKLLFKQVKKSLDKINNIRMLEQSLYSDSLKIAGRVDCIAEYDGILSIIDFKTSTQVKLSDMITDYFIQETLYAYMFAEQRGESIKQIVTIIATENSVQPIVVIRQAKDFLTDAVNRVKEYHKNFGNTGITTKTKEAI